MTRINYDFEPDEHQRWKLAATREGRSLKEWVRRALNAAADRDEGADEKRRRRK